MAQTQSIEQERWQPAGHARLPRVSPLRHVARALPAGDPDRGAVLLLGNFDGFHRGHQALLEAASAVAGEDLPLAVMSCEPHPRSFFCVADSPFRLTTPATKARRFASLRLDYVFSPRFDTSFASLTPAEFAQAILKEALGVSHVVAGDDFRFGKSRAGDVDLLAHLGSLHGFGVTSIAEIRSDALRCSSSQVRAHLRRGDIRAANAMLGAPWMAETVASGSRLVFAPTLCRPAAGLYLARTDTGMRRLHLGADGEIRTDRGPPLAPGLIRFLDRLA